MLYINSIINIYNVIQLERSILTFPFFDTTLCDKNAGVISSSLLQKTVRQPIRLLVHSQYTGSISVSPFAVVIFIL